MQKIWAVVPSAGMGKRMASPVKKQFIKLDGKELLVYGLEALSAAPSVEGIVLVCGEGDEGLCRELAWAYGLSKVQKIVTGGKMRQHSVYQGLCALPKDCGGVVIHDGARPFVTPGEIEATISALREADGAVLGIAVHDTVKRLGPDGAILETVPREELYLAATPQTFRYKTILEAHRHAIVMGDIACTDDAQVVEKYMNARVVMIPGSKHNIKITTAEDLSLGRWILEERV